MIEKSSCIGVVGGAPRGLSMAQAKQPAHGRTACGAEGESMMAIKWRMFLPTIAVLMLGCEDDDRDFRSRQGAANQDREVQPLDASNDETWNPNRGESRAMRTGFTEGEEIKRAVAVLAPIGNSRVSGTIEFVTRNGKVEVKGHVTGLPPGKHGFHVHEYGDLTSLEDGKSAGTHFNPTNMPHGATGSANAHLGDLGNIEANDRGEAQINITDTKLKLGGAHSIVGRSIVIHEKADDFSQPTGSSGEPIALGVIGIGGPQFKLTGMDSTLPQDKERDGQSAPDSTMNRPPTERDGAPPVRTQEPQP